MFLGSDQRRQDFLPSWFRQMTRHAAFPFVKSSL